jgi:hypothetical protein
VRPNSTSPLCISIVRTINKQARSWCETAAKEKLAGAYYCLGYLYQHGSGVDPNPKQAFGFYEQAARGGNISSMRALARMYENGDGTKPDHVQALNWYLLAAERGNQNAVADLKRMRSSMTDKEWKDTEKKLPPNFDRKESTAFSKARSRLLRNYVPTRRIVAATSV